ncbi:hypothetical protein ABPG72_003895 [Tetrahymena utriculariae]
MDRSSFNGNQSSSFFQNHFIKSFQFENNNSTNKFQVFEIVQLEGIIIFLKNKKKIRKNDQIKYHYYDTFNSRFPFTNNILSPVRYFLLSWLGENKIRELQKNKIIFQQKPTYSTDHQNRNLNSQKIQLIRITTDYSRLSQQPKGSTITQAQTDYLIPLSNTAINFFSNFIKVQPNSNKNVFNSNQTDGACLHVVPSQSNLTIGIADSHLHLYFIFYSDSTSSELANDGYCNRQQTLTYTRPYFGRVEYNLAKIQSTETDQKKAFQSILKIVLHEIIHILGFGFDFISEWKNRETNLLLGQQGAVDILTSVNLRSIDTQVLGSQKVLETARKYQNSSILKVQQLENQGEEGSKNSHWERTVIRNQLITASLISDSLKLSIFTVALLKDTRYWDDVNENLSDPIYWRKDKGCDFFQYACQSKQKYEEFSTDNPEACSFGYDGQGYNDNTDTYGDKCNFITNYSNALCDNAANQNSSSDEELAKTYQLNEFSYNSKCFISNLYHPDVAIRYQAKLRCHKYQCSSDKTQITITFSSIPGAQLACGINDEGKSKNVVFSSQTLGQITYLQNIMRLCDNQNCENFCSNNGICIKGSCLCNYGFGGADLCRQKCPNGQYAESNGNLCKLCDFYCSQCTGPNSNECLACQFLTYLNSNTCVQKCPIGKYADSLSKSCQSCPTGCSDCNSPSDFNICSDGYQKSGQTCVLSFCKATCKTCNFISIFCLSCFEGLCPSPKNTCLSSFPKGYFKNLSNMTCTPCPIGCDICSDSQNCTQCDTLKGYRQQGRQYTLCV